MRDVKRDSARHISQIPLSYMNSNRSGELLSKMSTDADSVQSFMEGGLHTAYSASLYYCVLCYLSYLAESDIVFSVFCNSSDLDSTWSQFCYTV